MLNYGLTTVVGTPSRLSENDIIDLGDQAAMENRKIFPERFFSHAATFTSLLDSAQDYPISWPVHTISPQYALLLAVLCRQLQLNLVPQTTGKPKLIKSLRGIQMTLV